MPTVPVPPRLFVSLLGAVPPPLVAPPLVDEAAAELAPNADVPPAADEVPLAPLTLEPPCPVLVEEVPAPEFPQVNIFVQSSA